MKYVLTNGVTYIAKKPNGKFTKTGNIRNAMTLGNESKAWNMLTYLPKAYKEEHYVPQCLNESQEQQIESENKKEAKPSINRSEVKKEAPPVGYSVAPASVSYEIKSSEQFSELKNNLLIADRTIGSIKALYTKAYQDLTATSDEILDIEHAIEFQRANAVKKCYLESELQNALRKRRECKDTMAILETVMKFKLEDWGTGKFEVELRRLDHRSYFPRCRKDLFE